MTARILRRILGRCRSHIVSSPFPDMLRTHALVLAVSALVIGGAHGALCDVALGVPVGWDPVLTTKPYYRSTYVFVSRHDRGLQPGSLDDPSLRRLRIGVQLIGSDGTNTPPEPALARRGIVANGVG